MTHVWKILADVCLETRMRYANNAALGQLLTSRENVLVLQTAWFLKSNAKPVKMVTSLPIINAYTQEPNVKPYNQTVYVQPARTDTFWTDSNVSAKDQTLYRMETSTWLKNAVYTQEMRMIVWNAKKVTHFSITPVNQTDKFTQRLWNLPTIKFVRPQIRLTLTLLLSSSSTIRLLTQLEERRTIIWTQTKNKSIE